MPQAYYGMSLLQRGMSSSYDCNGYKLKSNHSYSSYKIKFHKINIHAIKSHAHQGMQLAIYKNTRHYMSMQLFYQFIIQWISIVFEFPYAVHRKLMPCFLI